MHGVLVAGYEQITASKVLKGHFSGCPGALRSLVEKLIDGEAVQFDSRYDVLVIAKSPEGAILAIVDNCDEIEDPCPGADHAFYLVLRSLRAEELIKHREHCQPGPAPIFLDDVRHGDSWQFFNCYILDFTAWPRDKIYTADYPKWAS